MSNKSKSSVHCQGQLTGITKENIGFTSTYWKALNNKGRMAVSD